VFSVPVEDYVAQYIQKNLPRLILIMTGYPTKTKQMIRLFKSLDQVGSKRWYVVTVQPTDCRQCVNWQPKGDCPYADFNGCDGYEHYVYRSIGQ